LISAQKLSSSVKKGFCVKLFTDRIEFPMVPGAGEKKAAKNRQELMDVKFVTQSH
jgi:hypothetical protein